MGISFSAWSYFSIKIAMQEKADLGQYLNAMQGLRRGQDGDILEGVFSLLWKET